MNKYFTVTRPDFAKLPSLPLPFHVRSTGLFKLDANWRGMGGDKSPFAQVFWGVSGSGFLEFDDGPVPLGASDVAFMFQGESHRYAAGPEGWELRWFAFDGPGASDFLRSYKLPRLVRGAGPCPAGLFDEIQTALQEFVPSRQRRLVALAAEIVALAGGVETDNSSQGRLVSRFIELAQRNFSNASVNVNALADILGVHRTSLTKAFKAKKLGSPSDWLARLRMQKALALLADSGSSVAEIAELTGISDPAYFSRRVKQATGLSPKEYRDSFGLR